METFVSTIVTLAADGGILPSMVQSAQLQKPLMESSIWSTENSGKKNLHRVRQIEGVCEKVYKGIVHVGFWVGNCKGYGNADAQTGWNSISRIYVEEVPPPQV